MELRAVIIIGRIIIAVAVVFVLFCFFDILPFSLTRPSLSLEL